MVVRSLANITRPRLVVAGLWAASMLISWVGGTLVFGFDLGTTLIWLTILSLGPVLVWAFVVTAAAQARNSRLGRER